VDAWDITKGDPNVLVVVIDTGMDLTHPDWRPISCAQRGRLDFASADGSPDDEGDHGTACAGIALAIQDNTAGVTGIAPHCRIMPLRVNLIGARTRTGPTPSTTPPAAGLNSTGWS